MPGDSHPNQSNKEPTNSGFEQPEFRYLALGRIVKPHGLKGEVSMELMTDFPERFDTTEWFYLGNEYHAELYRLKSYRQHKARFLIQFHEITDRDGADTLRGLFVQVPIEEATPLPEGVYYPYQLVGLDVVTTTGETLGVIDTIIETGANDVYVVKGETKEVLLPSIPDVIKTVDLKTKLMTVEIIDGLI